MLKNQEMFWWAFDKLIIELRQNIYLMFSFFWNPTFNQSYCAMPSRTKNHKKHREIISLSK